MQKLLAIICLLFLSFTALAQEKLAGRWEGKIQSMQGERDTVVIFKKEGETYSGRSVGLRPGTEMQIKDVKVDGDNVTAKADVETPQATLVINYTFKLEGETMKGQGALDFNGQAISFEMNLKRVSANTDGPLTAATTATTAAAGQRGQQRPPVSIEQPQQKQSLDYFVGQWNFRYIGRESALAPAPREGLVTFAKSADGKSLNAVIEGKNDAGAYKESAVVTFDDATKTLNFTEKLSSGVKLSSKGDWSSPIAIRFAFDPVKVKNQSFQLRRIITVVASHSFTVTEDISENGGAFVRLGQALYSKVGAK